MTLSLEDFIKILKDKPDEHIARAIHHENRVKLHTEPTLEPTSNKAYDYFIDKVKQRIPDDAYDRFLSLIEWPFITVDYCEGVFSTFNKVFESADRYLNITFKNTEYGDDFKPYLKEIDNWFKESGVNTLKTKFNSFVVVDLPTEQESSKPEPYFYVLPSSNVERVKINRKNKVEYIVFDTCEKHDDKRILACFDDMYYRLVFEDGETYKPVLDEDGNPIEIKHGLGWTPVAPFWSDVLDPTVSMLNKKNPSTNSLGRLDILAFKMLSKEYSDLYNMYPIIWSYPEEEDAERINEPYGDEGLECDTLDSPIAKNISNSKKILTNPARHVIKPIPDEMGDVGDPMGFIEPTVDNLRFILEDLELRKENIEYSIAGKFQESKNDQAKNEKQISSGFESQYTVLLNVANNFAIIEEWIIKTCAALRYSPDSIKSVSVNNGRNFFLHTHHEIMEEIEASKKNKLPEYIIDQQEQAYIKTKYKSNPEKQERLEIIRMLTPYRQMNLEQVLVNMQFLDPEKVKLRLEFSDALSRFENKFGVVENYMKFSTSDELIEMDERIKSINEEFTLILTEYQSNTQPQIEEEESNN